MNIPVQLVLESLGSLEALEKREVIDEIIRRLRDLHWPLRDDEAIDRIADEAFSNTTSARRMIARADRGEVWLGLYRYSETR